MNVNKSKKISSILDSLEAQAKELSCIYQVEEVLHDYDQDTLDVFKSLLNVIPSGMQYTDMCQARIIYKGECHSLKDFKETPWMISAYLEVQNKRVGSIDVAYSQKVSIGDKPPFIEEETRLLIRIAIRLGEYIQHKNLRQMIKDVEITENGQAPTRVAEWKIVIDLAKRMDQSLFTRIARKLLNYLCWNGVEEANEILKKISYDIGEEVEGLEEGGNRPRQAHRDFDILEVSETIFNTAENHLSDEEILAIVQKWMQEDRASFLQQILVNLNSSLGEISDALRKFIHLAPEGIQLSDYTRKGVCVALVRRVISDQLDYIRIAKNHVDISDFYDLLQTTVFPVGSHGLVGGKSAGLFLAWQVIKRQAEFDDDLSILKVPKTWFITSDGLHNFLKNNNLEEVTEQKYKNTSQIRQEYPYIIQLFKNSQFTPEIIQGVSMALDDFGERPIIVRSSSLLEDRFGSAFSGKYKSLFLANQGTKKQRLQALLDAIAEVYASTFGSDPIEYRTERGLIDFKEEMGILIQAVVGKKVGKYFMPAFAGVAFSSNEFRWSPRIKREDGLVRLVMGLGTRAVDRLADDYPILIAPGQPGLRVNISEEEILRYSPHKMDVINLETNSFETVNIDEFVAEYGDEFPACEQVVSVIKEDGIVQPTMFNLDFSKDDVVVTFEGLREKTMFIQTMHKVLKLLEETFNSPVDVEFASNGKRLYLLQCRPQSFTEDCVPTPIPKDIPESAIVFTANKHVSNGTVPDITHIVYVDPDKYNELEDRSRLLDVGHAVSRLNKLLPKRQFILMGPGRWGSRGDIKLGVSVSYSDINNTAMLVEIAKQKGNYVPDLSFGTHFFQDLVEASIRYLPLYPDDKKTVFSEDFLNNSENILKEILPEHSSLSDVIRVIDVQKVTDGKVLKIYLNAEVEEAVGLLSQPSGVQKQVTIKSQQKKHQPSDDHWRWRYRISEKIACCIDHIKYGVVAFYIFGSTKNATAGPSSDIDILIHFRGTEEQKCQLLNWLDGWSQCLDEYNYLKTGYKTGGILDVHIVTDEDIENRSSYAVKIGAVTDAAKELPLTLSKDNLFS